jgi:predicted ester cyclase
MATPPCTLRPSTDHTVDDPYGATMNALTQLATDSVEVFDKADWDGIRARLGPTFRYEETGTGMVVDKADDFIAALQVWKTAAPDSAGELTRIVVDGDTCVLEVLWRGTQTGPLPTAAGVLPASGRPFEFRASVWQVWEHGEIVQERHHLDVLTMMAQLGALPTPVSA